MDRTATKVQRSLGSLKTIQNRKKTWDEINKNVISVEPPAKRRNMGVDSEAEAAFLTDDDEEMDEANENTVNYNAQAELQPAPESDNEDII